MTAAMAPSVRHTLNKVTLRYVQTEDRMRMDAQSSTGDSLTFWLTQRLCKELIAALVEYFTAQGGARGGRSATSVAAIQNFKQQQAKITKKAVAPVSVSKKDEHEKSGLLVTRLRLRSSDAGVLVSLPVREGEEAQLPFKPSEARQWMDILYQQYRVAGWPLDVWPRWMTEQPEVGVQGRGESVH